MYEMCYDKEVYKFSAQALRSQRAMYIIDSQISQNFVEK